MSDLTRRVLKADQYINKPTITDWVAFDAARSTLENSAATLARQVEAVENELSTYEEWLKSEGIGTSYEYGMDEVIRRIRRVLTEAEKGNTHD